MLQRKQTFSIWCGRSWGDAGCETAQTNKSSQRRGNGPECQRPGDMPTIMQHLATNESDLNLLDKYILFTYEDLIGTKNEHQPNKISTSCNMYISKTNRMLQHESEIIWKSISHMSRTCSAHVTRQNAAATSMNQMDCSRVPLRPWAKH